MSSPTAPPPSEQEITQYVIDRLSAFVTREDVVFDVCRAMEWEWDRADLFVKAAQETHFRRIALGQSPWFLVITLGILIVGIVLAGASGWFVWIAYQAGRLTDVPILLRAPRAVYAFIIGVCMIVGALGGLWVFLHQVIRGR